MVYIQTFKEQNWILPQNIIDLIPKDHISFLVENFVEDLDYSKFDMIYAGAGNPAYHPRRRSLKQISKEKSLFPF